MPDGNVHQFPPPEHSQVAGSERYPPGTNEQPPGIATVRPALYYPYIHIRSEHWLKATLLCAPAVKRIVPDTYAPEDTPEIRRYTTIEGPDGALLQAVPPYTEAAMVAQEQLRTKLAEHRKTIIRAYNKARAVAAEPYYIHTAKFTNDLLTWLKAHKLAWPDRDPNSYGDREWYALHPTLGKAIMTTLGLSIAGEQHYDIVTADGKFHEALLTATEDRVFEAVLQGAKRRPATRAQARQDLAQRVIMLTGVNYEALRPEDIPELQASKHFQGFQRILRHTASTVDLDSSPDAYDAQIRDEADQIVSAWHDVRNTISKTLRAVLFDAGLTLSGEALKAIVKPPPGMAFAVTGGIFIARAVGKVVDAQKSRNSPYQYLNQVVNAQQPLTRLMLPLGLER